METARTKVMAIARGDGPKSVDTRRCESDQGITVAGGNAFVEEVEVTFHPL